MRRNDTTWTPKAPHHTAAMVLAWAFHIWWSWLLLFAPLILMHIAVAMVDRREVPIHEQTTIRSFATWGGFLLPVILPVVAIVMVYKYPFRTGRDADPSLNRWR